MSSQNVLVFSFSGHASDKCVILRHMFHEQNVISNLGSEGPHLKGLPDIRTYLFIFLIFSFFVCVSRLHLSIVELLLCIIGEHYFPSSITLQLLTMLSPLCHGNPAFLGNHSLQKGSVMLVKRRQGRLRFFFSSATCSFSSSQIHQWEKNKQIQLTLAIRKP